MKWIFWSLMLANLAMFGWFWQQSGGGSLQQTDAVVPTSAGTRLVLVRELDHALPQLPPPAPVTVEMEDMVEPVAANTEATAQQENEQEPATTSAVAVADAAPPVLHCIRIAAIESQELLTETTAALARENVIPRAQGESVVELARFRVMVPPAANANAATKTLTKLQRAGIKDLFLIRSGDNKNAISLGVYSSKEQAQKRVQQIRESKIVSRIENISLPVKRWWLEFDWPGDDSWRQSVPPGLKDIEPQSCQ